MPLRVLYSFPHGIGEAGIGFTAWQQATQLAAAGHDVRVSAASVARPLTAGTRVTTTMVVAGRRIPHRVLGVDRTMALHDSLTARMLRRSRETFDVVHVWPGAALHTTAAAHERGITVVREVPNTRTSHAYEVVAQELDRIGMVLPYEHSHSRNPARLALEEREYGAVDGLLVPSEAVLQSFLGSGTPPECLLRHRYGYDPATAPEQRPRRDPGAPLVLAFVGRCEPRKGLHHALAAWRASGLGESGGQLLIAGTFVTGYRELLPDLLSVPGVRALGFVTDTTSVYAAADVLVLPTVEEGSALVTYEAQAWGCALAVSDASGAVVTHGQQGLVHPAGDVATLTTQLRLLGTDPRTRTRLQDGAWAHRGELTWAAAERALVAAYETAIERRRRGHVTPR